MSKLRVLLGVTGSVASIKTVPIVKELLLFAEVRVVSTKSAAHFFQAKELKELNVELFLDEHEWSSWKQKTDPVVHIDLRRWAHVFVIAPLSANTLAKIANGLCDNLLTCVARAWNFKRPLIVAPAMNTMMWEHPLTDKHLQVLKSLGIEIISPIEKLLVCRDRGFEYCSSIHIEGMGAMAEVNTIVDAVKVHIPLAEKIREQENAAQSEAANQN